MYSLLVLFLFIFGNAKASIVSLENQYKLETKSDLAYKNLEKQTLELANKAVPTLVKVMKSDQFPDKNRWLATMSLARIMGNKSIPFIKKFIYHPHWMLRLASLKVIRILKQSHLKKEIETALFDKSLFVRVEALDMVGAMKMNSSAPAVWKMLFDQQNYRKNTDGAHEKTNIIKRVIGTLGRLNFKPVQKSLVNLLKNEKFSDLTYEIDGSLTQLTGRSSPNVVSQKKSFWLIQNL